MGLNRKLVGAAGQHFAMYELLRRGYIAALTPEGVPNVDILVSDLVGDQLAAIQVKTASAQRPTWPLGQKQETISSPRLFYCFLMPTGEGMTAFESWIVPSSIVAEHVALSHATWLVGEPKRGSSRNDSDRRAMHHSCEPLDRYPPGWLNPYKNNWELIEK